MSQKLDLYKCIETADNEITVNASVVHQLLKTYLIDNCIVGWKQADVHRIQQAVFNDNFKELIEIVAFNEHELWQLILVFEYEYIKHLFIDCVRQVYGLDKMPTYAPAEGVNNG